MFLAKLIICGKRAMVPSGFVSSHKIPAGLYPTKRIRSTVPSVWPGLVKTPPHGHEVGKHGRDDISLQVYNHLLPQ